MPLNNLGSCVKVAACICGKDGIITEVEEQKMLQILEAQFPEFSYELFEQAIAEFFDSDDQIEDYLSQIDDEELRHFTLQLSEDSARADGLDIRENIALQKAYMVWGINRNA